MVLDRSALAGRYEVREVLEDWHRIERSVAWDQQRHEEVVVESIDLDALPPATAMRVESEASLLRRVKSPWAATVVDVARERRRLFLVLRRTTGVPLSDRIRGTGHLPVRDVLTLARCVFSALADIHGAGVVHAAVRPEHILVDGTPLDGAVLAGTGFARVAQLVGPPSDEPISVLRYLSPEQAGLTPRQVDERSDLYSLGLVLFEALTGRPAFTAESARDLLLEGLSTTPPHVRSLGMAVPRIIDEFLQRLLRKDPTDRYQSAVSALFDLDAITRLLDYGQTEPMIALGSADRRTHLTQPLLVGREDEFATLESHVGQARLGLGDITLISGRSGDGKTRLLDELALRAAAQGMLVLRGQALDHTGRRPFAPLAEVVRGLSSLTQSDSGLADRLRLELGEHLDATCQALPDLAGLLRPAGAAPTGPEAHGEARSTAALAALLDGLGSRERPAVLLLDDCQWADELTIRLLGRWDATEPVRRRYVAVVAAFRTDEGNAPLLKTLRHGTHVVLPPLDPPAIRRLVESMAGPVPEAVPGLVASLAQGSPFMASAVLRGLVESGVLVAGDDGWILDPPSLDRVQSSRHSADLLARRIELLPPPGLQLLAAAAVLGREFDIELAGRLADLSLREAVEAVGEAQRRHFVWTTGHSGRAAFVHDRLRDAFLLRSSDDERRKLHGRAALALQAEGAVSPFDLAYHFDAAGRSDQAFSYALAAAEQARSQHSLAIAEDYYLIARRGAGARDRETRRRVSEGLGEVLMLRGTYAEAARHLAEALELASDPVEQARLEGRLGELAFKQNDVVTATHWLRSGLRRLGQPAPRQPVLAFAVAVKEIGVFAARRLTPRQQTHRPPSSGTVDLLAGHLYGRLILPFWVQGRILGCLYGTFRHVNLASRYEPTPTLGQAWSDLGVLASIASRRWGRYGLEFVERSLEVRRTLGDAWGEANALHFYGVVLHAGGQYAAAVERCRMAVPLLERTGDRWELNSARWHLALSHYRLGDLHSAAREAERVVRDGLDIGDREAAAIALEILARATQGHVPAGLTAAVSACTEVGTGDIQTAVAVLQGEAIQLLAQQRAAEAADRLQQARALAGGTRNTYLASAFAWSATAARTAVAQESLFAPRTRRRALRRAAAVTRQALRRARVFRNELPQALREAGLVAAMRGRSGRARTLLDQSVDVAAGLDAEYEHALSRQARGEVGLAFGWDGAEEELVEARAVLDRLTRHVEADRRSTGAWPAWLSLTDRFDALLDTGRRITSAESPEGVAGALCDAALTTLRAERCLVLDLPGGTDLAKVTVVAGRHDLPWSQALVRAAIAAGRPVVFTEGDPAPHGDGTDGFALGGARSVLCVPVTVNGVVAKCLYAVHTQVAGLFGAEDSDLASFIATLAGAAWERERLAHDVIARVIDAQEAERARVARDLHDEIGQALTSVLLGLRLVHESIPTHPEDATRQNERVRELVSDALLRVRGLAFELRPAVLDDLGLPAALRRLARDYAERHQLTAEMVIDGLDNERLPPEVDTAVYRVTQEALTNVVRHSGASTCRVSVLRSGSNLRVTVEDHGRGFDPPSHKADTFGMRGMAERAALVGGTLAIDSVAGEGTLVVLEVPLP